MVGGEGKEREGKEGGKGEPWRRELETEHEVNGARVEEHTTAHTRAMLHTYKEIGIPQTRYAHEFCLSALSKRSQATLNSMYLRLIGAITAALLLNIP